MHLFYTPDIAQSNELPEEEAAHAACPALLTEKTFRLICKEFGAALVVGEMVSDKAILFGNEKTKSKENYYCCRCSCDYYRLFYLC